jgi:cyclophilin family peptidyl-prolyl cis-trans isomerase
LLAPVLAELEAMHPQDLRIVYRHFPLPSIHDKAILAAEAAEAAGEQGAFWAMHDLLYMRYQDWANLSPEGFREWLVERAEDLGLDTEAFAQSLAAHRHRPKVEAALRQALELGLQGTPTMFINGELVRFGPDIRLLEAAVRLALLRPRQQEEPPPLTLKEDRIYLATLHFDVGEVLIEIHPQWAPQAANVFVFLAQNGWYDSNIVHRVLPGTLVELGDPTGTGYGIAGFFYNLETDPEITFVEPGMVAMSAASPTSNASQFFITLAPLPQLNGTRSIFGRVVAGLEILAALPARDPLENLLEPPGATLLSISLGEP